MTAIEVTRVEGAPVTVLEINRHTQRNALDLPTIDDLRAALSDATERSDSVVLTGSGSVFCAGADLTSLPPSDGTPDGGARRQAALARIGDAVADLQALLSEIPVLTVAALNGHAVGGGWSLAMACDVQIAVWGTRCWFPEAAMGRAVGAPSVELAVRHLGQACATRAVLLGVPFHAEELEAKGVLAEVVTAADLRQHAVTVARQAAGLTPEVLRQIKNRLRASAAASTCPTGHHEEST